MIIQTYLTTYLHIQHTQDLILFLKIKELILLL